MARLIINRIKEDNFKPKEIKMEDYFGKLPYCQRQRRPKGY